MYKIVKNNTERKIVEVNGKETSIPVDWEVKKLGDISQTYTGNTPSTKEEKFWTLDEHNGAIPWVTTPNFKDVDQKLFSGYLTKFGQKQARIVQAGSLLVSCIATIGEVAIYNRDVAFNQQINAISYTDQYNLPFIKFCLLNTKTQFIKHADMSIVRIMNKKSFNMYEVICPDNIKTQNNIANLLSSLEETIFKTEKLISMMEKRLRYYVRELTSGKLRIRIENGEQILVPNDSFQTIIVDGKDVQIPIDWNVQYIGEVLKNNPKSTIKAGDFDSLGEYPAFNCSKNKSKRFNSSNIKGENLFFSTGGTASVHYFNGECAFSTDVLSKSIVNTNDNILYVYYYLSSQISKIEKMFYGSGLKHLNKHELNNLFIGMPTYIEQNHIAYLLKREEEDIEKMKSLLQMQKKRLKWAMSELLSGRYILEKID